MRLLFLLLALLNYFILLFSLFNANEEIKYPDLSYPLTAYHTHYHKFTPEYPFPLFTEEISVDSDFIAEEETENKIEFLLPLFLFLDNTFNNSGNLFKFTYNSPQFSALNFYTAPWIEKDHTVLFSVFRI